MCCFPFENICAVVIILLIINLEGYQDPNVKDTYKMLNKYVFLYIEIKCNSRQINEFRIYIHFRRVKFFRYSQSIYHEKYIESILNGRCIGGDDLHSAETPFSIRPVILIQVCSSTLIHF